MLDFLKGVKICNHVLGCGGIFKRVGFELVDQKAKNAKMMKNRGIRYYYSDIHWMLSTV